VETALLVHVTVPAAAVEVAADLLWSLGATAVVEQPVSRGAAGPDQSVVLVAGFPTIEAARAAPSQLPAAYPTELVEVTDEDSDVWRQYAQPVEVGSLVVVPAWRTVAIGTGRVVVQIDPGRCFGSGSHPTTRLLLTELDRRLRPGDRVLDVGTGSGILAVTAAVLGAAAVTAVDIDPEAVAVTRANAVRNGVTRRLEVSTRDAGAGDQTYDIVVANLTAGVLAGLAGTLIAAAGRTGLLLMSGLLVGQWVHLAGRFAPMAVIDLPELEGWTAAVLGATGPEPGPRSGRGHHG
jgi:ribosomal protein L11 methyltransferase